MAATATSSEEIATDHPQPESSSAGASLNVSCFRSFFTFVCKLVFFNSYFALLPIKLLTNKDLVLNNLCILYVLLYTWCNIAKYFLPSQSCEIIKSGFIWAGGWSYNSLERTLMRHLHIVWSLLSRTFFLSPWLKSTPAISNCITFQTTLVNISQEVQSRHLLSRCTESWKMYWCVPGMEYDKRH